MHEGMCTYTTYLQPVAACEDNVYQRPVHIGRFVPLTSNLKSKLNPPMSLLLSTWNRQNQPYVVVQGPANALLQDHKLITMQRWVLSVLMPGQLICALQQACMPDDTR